LGPEGTEVFITNLDRGAVECQRLGHVVILGHSFGTETLDVHFLAYRQLIDDFVKRGRRAEVNVQLPSLWRLQQNVSPQVGSTGRHLARARLDRLQPP
jgi:hypothetical protein